MRYWPAEMFDLGNQAWYWSLAASVTIGTGGGNKNAAIWMSIGTDPAMATRTTMAFKLWTANDPDLKVYNGVKAAAPVNPTYDYARIFLVIQDVSSISGLAVDCVAVMFNPFDGSGYYELENVFPSNGPNVRYDKFARLVKTPTQVAHQYDPSGGAEVIRLGLEFRNESQDFYENMLRFFRFNKGTPGIAGRPLALEPNIPGLPPVIVGNFLNPTFPLVRDTSKAEFYSGTFEFETMW